MVNRDLLRTYDAIWENAAQHILCEGVQTDAHLLNRADDARRGLTLVVQPESLVRARVVDFLQELATVLPGQHVYAPESLHLTVLSLISASAQLQLSHELLGRYQHVVAQAVQGVRPLRVRFYGITASPSAVLIQGFPEADELNRLRDSLRAAAHALGLGDGLDVRYRITTAHMTVLRFVRQPPARQAMIEALGAYRHYDFGATSFDTLQLVTNDWYMSPDRVERLATYQL